MTKKIILLIVLSVLLGGIAWEIYAMVHSHEIERPAPVHYQQ